MKIRLAFVILMYALAMTLIGIGIYRTPAHGAESDWKDAPQNVREWFQRQKNGFGVSCCVPSDGEPYYGNYAFDANGNVVLFLPGGNRIIPKKKVLLNKDDPNPTGHAIWWHSGSIDWCFAPGALF